MEKNSKERSEKNKIEVADFGETRQAKRIELIIADIVAGLSKNKIIDKYVEAWGVGRKTVATVLKEAVISLSEELRTSKEEARAISNVRLESVWDECKSVNQKLKTIDLINKTNNLYDNNVVVSTDEDGFVFDIGVETKEKDYFDDREEHNQE